MFRRDDVAAGEKFLNDIYYALRNGKNWEDTLLVVTYDEHGGNYDHVAPPNTATQPDDSVGEFGFDFKRFGVRIPALLISPRIKAGTVFRASEGDGEIDHTSVLKTISLLWDVPPLTARVAAAAGLGDVLTLDKPRTDDPLKGVKIPISSASHPAKSVPSKLETIHAKKLSQLPIRNDQGTYDHTPPDLSSSAEVGDYIRGRSAAWSQHVDRTKQHAPRAHTRAQTHAHSNTHTPTKHKK